MSSREKEKTNNFIDATISKFKLKNWIHKVTLCSTCSDKSFKVQNWGHFLTDAYIDTQLHNLKQ
jgi:hypothetical protein